jgi:hypothetical protein
MRKNKRIQWALALIVIILSSIICVYYFIHSSLSNPLLSPYYLLTYVIIFLIAIWFGIVLFAFLWVLRESERWLSSRYPKPKQTIIDTPPNQEDNERLPHPEIRKRRENVKKLWGQGHTDAEMAESLSCSEKTVQRDRESWGLKSR